MIINEVQGSLLDSNGSLVCPVSIDFAMRSKLAQQFNNRFGRKELLLKQKVKVGQIAWLADNDRYLFYLIVTKASSLRYDYSVVKETLHNLYLFCKEKKITSISLPRLGFGSSQLNWNIVRGIIETTFRDLPITITVYFI